MARNDDTPDGKPDGASHKGASPRTRRKADPLPAAKPAAASAPQTGAQAAKPAAATSQIKAAAPPAPKAGAPKRARAAAPAKPAPIAADAPTPAPKIDAKAKVSADTAEQPIKKPAARPATKPAAKAGARAPSTRARTTVRADTRTSTRRKPKAPKPTAEEMLATAAPATPVPAAPAAAPAATEQNPAPQAAQENASVQFMEAAFGPKSRLPEQLTQNIERIESLTQRLIGALSQRKPKNPGVEGPGPDLLSTAATGWMKALAEQPEKIVSRQVGYWGETLRHFAEAQAALVQGKLTAPPDEGPNDRRFANPLWQSHPFFNFIKRQYQINTDALLKAATDLDVPDLTDRRRIEWFTRQIIDMMAPTNFLATNPDALEKALSTEGQSLVKGLENLVRDVESHGGEMIVSLADRDSFRVGENIGTSEGRVVARTRLFELIQYSPTTDQVHAIPLVIFPPWINKFYIMDLKPQNSLIKWVVDQGYTLFVVAWKNPDPSYADVGMGDYVSAYLEIMDRVRDITDQPKLNAVGYCIAGTTLSLTLSLLKQRGDDRVNAATFFTTLTDFSEQGEFTAFLQDDFLSGIEEEIARDGVLSSQLMTRTFSFLRANDLVWGPAIRSYMLGETPPAFDLLFWNGDGTNLPGKMAKEYLRGLCQRNVFVKEGFELFGHMLNVRDVTLPLCAIACETDHIAPARDSWRGIAQMGSKDKTFILSESGHIAGIINPPSKKKYGHYTSDHGFSDGYDAWRTTASFHAGSWWGRWDEWLARMSGGMVPRREPEAGLGPAPGEYVHE